MDSVGSLAVVIAAYNEAERLSLLLADLQAGALPLAEVLVVDGVSSDRTAQIAGLAGARVLRGARSRAIGPGCKRLPSQLAAFPPWGCSPAFELGLRCGWGDGFRNGRLPGSQAQGECLVFPLGDRWVEARLKTCGMDGGPA